MTKINKKMNENMWKLLTHDRKLPNKEQDSDMKDWLFNSSVSSLCWSLAPAPGIDNNIGQDVRP